MRSIVVMIKTIIAVIIVVYFIEEIMKADKR